MVLQVNATSVSFINSVSPDWMDLQFYVISYLGTCHHHACPPEREYNVATHNATRADPLLLLL